MQNRTRPGPRIYGALVLFVTMLCGPSLASAASIIVQSDVAQSASDGTGGLYGYDVSLSAGSTIQTGDFFTLIDFGSLFGSSAPAGWVASSPLQTTFTAPPLNTIPNIPFDDAGIANVTFTYTGLSTIDNSTGVVNLSIGDFTATSDATLDALISFGAQDHLNGNSVSNGGLVLGPTGARTLVPLPAAAWGGLALFGLLGGSYLKRRKAA